MRTPIERETALIFAAALTLKEMADEIEEAT